MKIKYPIWLLGVAFIPPINPSVSCFQCWNDYIRSSQRRKRGAGWLGGERVDAREDKLAEGMKEENEGTPWPVSPSLLLGVSSAVALISTHVRRGQ